MATSARNRKRRESMGNYGSWEDREKEKKVQKTLENYDKEEDDEQR
jgi:hypothetical protein